MAGRQQKQQQESQESREAAMEAYERFLEEARGEPIKYLKHDTKAHDDEALYRLVAEHGMEWYGWYWLLVELLASRKGHSYDVSDDAGWRRLAHDMSCMADISVDDCQLLVMQLAHLELVDRDYLSELHKVSIRRVRHDAESYAEEVAKKKLGAWKTNRRRMFGL